LIELHSIPSSPDCRISNWQLVSQGERCHRVLQATKSGGTDLKVQSPAARCSAFVGHSPERPPAFVLGSVSRAALTKDPTDPCGVEALTAKQAKPCALARRSRGFRLCCGGRGLGGYPRDRFLSLFHGPGYIGHQLFQIVLGGLKLRRLGVHFHLPIRRGKGLARSIQGQSE